MGTADYIWPVQDAKARFSMLLETCLRDGPQVISKRGHKAAVLVSVEEWQRLQRSASPTLKDLLLSDNARTDALTPERGRAQRRAAPDLD